MFQEAILGDGAGANVPNLEGVRRRARSDLDALSTICLRIPPNAPGVYRSVHQKLEIDYLP